MSILPITSGPKLKALKEIKADFLGTINKRHEEHGDTYIATFPMRTIVTRDPVLLKHILHDNFNNYPKATNGPITKEIFKLTNNSNSLFFTNDFDFWKSNRQIATPSFLPSKLREYVPRMVTYTEEVLDLYEQAAASGKPFNVKELLGSLTLKNMLYNLLEDCDLNFHDFHYQMKEALDQIFQKGVSFYGIRWLLPTQDRRKRNESFAYVKQTTLDIINQREQSSKIYDDLLDHIMKFYRENFLGEEINANLVGDIIVYLIAGHDTTASTINALYMYFSLHPHVEEKVLEEIEEIVGGGKINFETANKLVYTKMVFQEALRLQSPLPATNRISIEEDHIAGYTIPAGSLITLNYRGTNRNPAYWDNPEAFEPERFREKRWGQDHQYAYLPFGGGHRLCIGMNFAYLEAVVALAILLPKYRFTLMPGRDRKARFGLTSWPGGAEEMMVHRR